MAKSCEQLRWVRSGWKFYVKNRCKKRFHTQNFPPWHRMTLLDHVGSDISDLTSHSSRKKFIFTGLLAGGAYYFIKAWWVFVAHGHRRKHPSCWVAQVKLPKVQQDMIDSFMKELAAGQRCRVRTVPTRSSGLEKGDRESGHISPILPTIFEHSCFFWGKGRHPYFIADILVVKKGVHRWGNFVRNPTSFR